MINSEETAKSVEGRAGDIAARLAAYTAAGEKTCGNLPLSRINGWKKKDEWIEEFQQQII